MTFGTLKATGRLMWPPVNMSVTPCISGLMTLDHSDSGELLRYELPLWKAIPVSLLTISSLKSFRD